MLHSISIVFSCLLKLISPAVLLKSRYISDRDIKLCRWQRVLQHRVSIVKHTTGINHYYKCVCVQSGSAVVVAQIQVLTKNSVCSTGIGVSKKCINKRVEKRQCRTTLMLLWTLLTWHHTNCIPSGQCPAQVPAAAVTVPAPKMTELSSKIFSVFCFAIFSTTQFFSLIQTVKNNNNKVREMRVWFNRMLVWSEWEEKSWVVLNKIASVAFSAAYLSKWPLSLSFPPFLATI